MDNPEPIPIGPGAGGLSGWVAGVSLEVVSVQRRMDADWALTVGRMRRDWEEAGLLSTALGRMLEERARPARGVVGEARCVLETDIVRRKGAEVGIELRPLNLGYRAAYGVSRRAHCRVEWTLRQVPVGAGTGAAGSVASPGPGVTSVSDSVSASDSDSASVSDTNPNP